MQKNNGELFTTMPVGKAVAKLAIPTVISQIVVILYSLADTFFVGQIGDPNQLAALSVYGQRDEAPAQRLHDKDRKRRAYYELYTNTTWGEASNYVLCLDSGVSGIEKCVEMIRDLY